MPLATLPPLSLYVHMPWCVRKCPYCDFNSHAVRDGIPEREYIDALLADLDHELSLLDETRPLVSIFMGGGTPSLFSPASIGRLIEGIQQRIHFAPDIEITLEANPGTVERGRFAEYRAAGINRLSIGVQSFNDDLLHRIGRIHSSADANRAAEEAHAAGLDNFNLDLMYGLPGQGLPGALTDIAQATTLSPAHLSWYQLTLEPNTAFHASPPSLPVDDLIWDMQLAGQDKLADSGYQQYEISAYARPGRRCRHNLNYWHFGDYLGIGAGAHGKLSSGEAIQRRWKHKHPADYLQHAVTGALSGTRALSGPEATFEFMMNALRLNAGFAPAIYAERTGLNIGLIEAKLLQCADEALLEFTNGAWKATAQGRCFLDTVVARFLSEE